MQVLRLVPHAVLPVRGSPGAVGYDLTSIEPVVLKPGERGLFSTGLAIIVPEGTYGRVAPRSGLTVKNGLHVGAGVIDPDYRGEVKVSLFNLGSSEVELSAGSKVAQLILEKVELPDVVEVTSLDETVRGSGGFGSTDEVYDGSLYNHV
jgi:dUTP pyrophosphatase